MEVGRRYVLGFDPGGAGQFGWCLCCFAQELPLTLLASGNADHAKGAVYAALGEIPQGASPQAAGIDAPMFWVADGGRKADQMVRDAITRAGAPSASGTVQHFNSLRGACLVQGMLAARLLRARYPELPITEAHPKALLWLMGLANRRTAPADIPVSAFCAVPDDLDPRGLSEHERDAVLAALGARAMLVQASGWADLAQIEKNAIAAIDDPVGYWMPLVVGRA